MSKPAWIRSRPPSGERYRWLSGIVRRHHLATVCESARCPNLGECWSAGAATIMILGDTCSRSCRFCAVTPGCPSLPEADEPDRVADAVRLMGLRHVVITSVTRDDLSDGGAAHWRRTVEQIRAINPGVAIEVLLPDFRGDLTALDRVLDAGPGIVAHNLETVPRLTPLIRSAALFDRSLGLLQHSIERGFPTKTGIMLGLGETRDEIRCLIARLAALRIAILTLGQYLCPTPLHQSVERWVPPEEFAEWKVVGESLGIRHVESGPLVRSSYRAQDQVLVAAVSAE